MNVFKRCANVFYDEDLAAMGSPEYVKLLEDALSSMCTEEECETVILCSIQPEPLSVIAETNLSNTL